MDYQQRIAKNKLLLDAFKHERSRHYYRGEVILHAGDQPDFVFFIVSGIVKSYYITSRGQENLAFYHQEADFFPIIWTFIEAPSPLYYEALTNVEVMPVPREDFLQGLEGRSNLMKAALLEVVQKLDSYTERINNTQFSSSYARVAYAMISLTKNFGISEEDSIRIDAPLTHQLIADSIGLSRETTSRQIERLIKEGALAYRGRSIHILDIDHLRQITQE